MIGHFAEVAPDGRCINCIPVALPALEMPAPTDPANVLVPIAAPLVWDNASPTAVLYLIDGVASWVETAPLAEIKARKNAEIDAARESANRTYFDFAGQRIACEDMSWKDIISTNAEISITHQMPANWVGGWKAKDKTPEGGPIYVAIPDVATWVLFIQAMVARGTAHFLKSQGLKNQLAAATSPEQIAAISWGESP